MLEVNTCNTYYVIYLFTKVSVRMQKKVDACKSEAVISFMIMMARALHKRPPAVNLDLPFCPMPSSHSTPITHFFQDDKPTLEIEGRKEGEYSSLPTFLQTHSLPTNPFTSNFPSHPSTHLQVCFVLLICIVEVFEPRSDLGGLYSTITLLSACSVSKFESSHHTQIPHGIRPPVKIPQIRNSISSIRKSLKSEFPPCQYQRRVMGLARIEYKRSTSRKPIHHSRQTKQTQKTPRFFPQQYSFKANIIYTNFTPLVAFINFFSPDEVVCAVVWLLAGALPLGG